MPPDVDLPRLQSLLWPTLVAVKELGGSGSIAEIEAKVVELIDATEAQQAVLHKQGPLSQINYMVAWCRTYLKFAGYLVNTVRGVWSLTETGRLATEADMIAVRLQYREASRTRLLTSFRWLDGPAVRHRRRSPQSSAAEPTLSEPPCSSTTNATARSGSALRMVGIVRRDELGYD
jgi:restriction endonuclease Mrr